MIVGVTRLTNMLSHYLGRSVSKPCETGLNFWKGEDAGEITGKNCIVKSEIENLLAACSLE
jgi:hypothetical protein